MPDADDADDEDCTVEDADDELDEELDVVVVADEDDEMDVARLVELDGESVTVELDTSVEVTVVVVDGRVAK